MNESQLAKDRNAIKDNLIVRLSDKSHKMTLASAKPKFSSYDFKLLKNQYAYDNVKLIKRGLDERYNGHGDINEAKAIANVPDGFKPTKRSYALRGIAVKMRNNPRKSLSYYGYHPIVHEKPLSNSRYMNSTQINNYAQKQINAVNDKVRDMFSHHKAYNNVDKLGAQRGNWQSVMDYARKHPHMRAKTKDIKSGHIKDIIQTQILNASFDNVTGNKHITQINPNIFKRHLHHAKSVMLGQTAQLNHVAELHHKHEKAFHFSQYKHAIRHHGPTHDGPTLG